MSNESTATGPVIGIDLGTTNSVVAAFVDGQIQVIETDGTALLPSIVGLALDGKLVTGLPARNQLAAFPDRTIASIKRKMGEDVRVKMADQEYSPQEISAIILRTLRDRAEEKLGQPVRRAVITVPAFFNEDQRQATREAGELAGLTVERIINEPTAASLVYRAGDEELRNLVVYDLGGGTFDVSIVRMEQGVIEVLSSKGDTQLGGDDFDQLLMNYVARAFLSESGIDLLADSRSRWRLLQACERAKCALSTENSTRITEEFISESAGLPRNLDMTIQRSEYEQLIAGSVEKTIECVDQALRDSGLTLNRIDDLVLVGGSTRTPLVQNRLREEFHREPHWAVNPDLAVALGAATQAAIQNGVSPGPVLVDVATHSLGIEAIDEQGRLKFYPIIHRNSPLPARYEEQFFTSSEDQEIADIHAWQGESPNLAHNRSIGKFLLEGLNQDDDADRKILVRFDLSLDGTLSVSARESRSGIQKSIEIQNATSRLASDEKSAAISRLHTMFGDDGLRSDVIAGGGNFGTDDAVDSLDALNSDATFGNPFATGRNHPADHHMSGTGSDTLMARAAAACKDASAEDASDIQRLLEAMENAQSTRDTELIASLQSELEDLLFYVAS